MKLYSLYKVVKAIMSQWGEGQEVRGSFGNQGFQITKEETLFYDNNKIDQIAAFEKGLEAENATTAEERIIMNVVIKCNKLIEQGKTSITMADIMEPGLLFEREQPVPEQFPDPAVNRNPMSFISPEPPAETEKNIYNGDKNPYVTVKEAGHGFSCCGKDISNK